MSEQTTGKGKPTPKRSEAQGRRTGPVAPPPTNRREAAKALRAKNAANRGRIREGSQRGDDNALLKRDQGPVRRLVRDLVDVRRTLGWVLLPTALVVVVTGFMKNTELQAMTFAFWLASLAAVAIDMVFVGRDVRREVRKAFPDEEKLRGHVVYALMRTTQMRRLRVPRPAVRP